jgi:hypothetical protein
MCEQHNQVNEKLGKPLFPCDLAVLDERWRASRRKSCWPGKVVQKEEYDSKNTTGTKDKIITEERKS